MNRNNQIEALRPEISTIERGLVCSDEEKFQNDVLRPIIKFQHDLILQVFKIYISQKKIDLLLLNHENKIAKIELILQKDRVLLAELKGAVVGLFTVEEYGEYARMKSGINKRIIQIVKQRILSVIAYA